MSNKCRIHITDNTLSLKWLEYLIDGLLIFKRLIIDQHNPLVWRTAVSDKQTRQLIRRFTFLLNHL